MKLHPTPAGRFWLVYLTLMTIACTAALTSCASLGLATPKGFDQSLAEGYGVYTAVVSATATAVTTGSLTSAEGESIQGQTKNIRTMLDAAKTAEGVGNLTTAQSDLAVATQVLGTLQAYLNRQSKGSK